MTNSNTYIALISCWVKTRITLQRGIKTIQTLGFISMTKLLLLRTPLYRAEVVQCKTLTKVLTSRDLLVTTVSLGRGKDHVATRSPCRSRRATWVRRSWTTGRPWRHTWPCNRWTRTNNQMEACIAKWTFSILFSIRLIRILRLSHTSLVKYSRTNWDRRKS